TRGRPSWRSMSVSGRQLRRLAGGAHRGRTSSTAGRIMRTETTRTLSVAVISIVSLLGVLMSVYLLMVKYGYIGTLACGASGGCSTVQSSRWGVLLGVPVPGRRLTV